MHVKSYTNCPHSHSDSFVCGFVTIWTLSLISIDRYTCIVHGIKYRISPTLAVVLIILVWLFTVITFSPLAIYFVVKECPFGQDTVSICTLGWPKTEGFPFVIGFTLLVVTSGFVIPVVILIFSHISIAIKFRKVSVFLCFLSLTSTNPIYNLTTKRQKISDIYSSVLQSFPHPLRDFLVVTIYKQVPFN